jgi:hypothetical protein
MAHSRSKITSTTVPLGGESINKEDVYRIKSKTRDTFQIEMDHVQILDEE